MDALERPRPAAAGAGPAPASARFWDKVAAKYASQPVADEAAYREKLRLTRQYLTPESRVWEFGCGTGSTALAHAPFVASIEATDVSGRMIEIAEGKAREAGTRNVTFRRASVDEWTPPPGSVDMVMAHSILHLVEDRDVAIRRAWEALRPGGVLVSSTFCGSDELPLLRFALPLMRLVGKAPRVWFFTAQDLEASMTRAGFEIAHRWRPEGKLKALFLVARKP